MPVPDALAQSAGAAPGGFDVAQLLPLVLIFALFYFLILRPQQKRNRAHQEMISGLRRNDIVVFAGGLVGRITRLQDDGVMTVDIGDNTRVQALRNSVSELRVRDGGHAPGHDGVDIRKQGRHPPRASRD